MTDIKSFFHQANGNNIFCTTIGDLNKADSCVIYFSPLFEERMWVQRIAFNYACDFWNKFNIPVFIFDYYGYGESDGESEDFSFEQCKNDWAEIAAFLGDNYQIHDFIFWAIRTGSNIALYNLDSIVSVSKIILWFPIFDLQKYIFSELRSVISFQSSVYKKILVNRDKIIEDVLSSGECIRDTYAMNNIDGYRFGKTFLEEVHNLGPINHISKINRPSLIINTESKSKKPLSIENQISGIPDKNDLIFSTSVNAPAFWKYSQNYSQRLNNIFNITSDWHANSLRVD